MSEYVNPDDFIIARKRKKYKFAQFSNAPNCYELDEWTKQAVDIVELGAGTAQFLIEQARLRPDLTHAAIDVKADRLQKGALEALEQGVSNIVFIRARADQIDQLFTISSLQSLWLTFSDPFPRPRSARRRMTHALYLALYETVLSTKGSLYIKHDDPLFFQWTLEQLVQEEWMIEKLTFDLHESDENDSYKIMTSYETRWLSEGRTTSFVSAHKPRS